MPPAKFCKIKNLEKRIRSTQKTLTSAKQLFTRAKFTQIFGISKKRLKGQTMRRKETAVPQKFDLKRAINKFKEVMEKCTY